MKVRIEHGGGYQDTGYEMDAVPRVGEIIRIGGWVGPVTEVTHVPLRNDSGRLYRGSGDPAVILRLSGSEKAADYGQRWVCQQCGNSGSYGDGMVAPAGPGAKGHCGSCGSTRCMAA